MTTLVVIADVLVAAAMVFGIGLHCRYLRMMRLSHPATWQSLGRPTLFSIGGTLIMSFRVLRFLWRKDYHTIGDQEFSRVSDWVRTYNFLFVCFLCGFVLFVLLLQTHVLRTI
jgi:hypothetical protein